MRGIKIFQRRSQGGGKGPSVLCYRGAKIDTDLGLVRPNRMDVILNVREMMRIFLTVKCESSRTKLMRISTSDFDALEEELLLFCHLCMIL